MKKIMLYTITLLLILGVVSAMDFDPNKCEYIEFSNDGYGYECYQYECSQGALDDFGNYFYSKYMSWEDFPNNERYPEGWTEKIFIDGDCPPENERNHEPSVPMHPSDVPEFNSIGIGVVIAVMGLFIMGKKRK